MGVVGKGDRAVSWVAARQHGVVSTEQVRLCGLARDAVRGRLRGGSWRRLQPGTYLVGVQEPSDQALILAAVMSCSPRAVAGGPTAAWLWGLLEGAPAEIHVTMLDRRNPGARKGVRIHRPRAHPPRETRWRDGIPLTAPEDTLLALAGVYAHDELEAATALALSKRLTTGRRLRSAVDAAPPLTGIATLRRVVASGDSPALTRSANERAMHRLVLQAELPPAQANVVVGGKEVDLYWPEARLAVEVDAWGTHGDTESFERDRHVDTDLKASGIEVVRFTSRRIRTRPHAVVARLAAVLALRLGDLPPARR